jgi:predicted O-methyltransferase YrrM
MDDLIEKILPTLPGWCTVEKGKRLAKLATDARANLCVELGVFGGRSLVAIASGLARNGFGRVDGIDPYTAEASLEGANSPENDKWWAALDYDDILKQAVSAIEDSGLKNQARILRRKSLEVADQYEDGSIDILHVDSNHAEEVSVAEVNAWARKVRLGGFWVADDSDWSTLRRAQELLEADGFVRVELFDRTPEASAWTIFQKTGAGRIEQVRRDRKQPIGYFNAVSYFDSVCCINLDRRTDRWAQAKAEFERCGINRYSRIAGVDNRENGVAGCAVSHRELWRQIASGNFGARVFIVEDDFQFITREVLSKAGYSADSGPMRAFDSCAGTTFGQRLATMLPYIPSQWDLLYLGGFYTSPDNVRLNRHVIQPGGMYDLHAYAISQDYACRITALLDSVMPVDRVGAPIDVVLDCQIRHGDVFAYTLSPRLFIQRAGVMSDISRSVVGFPHARIDATLELFSPTQNVIDASRVDGWMTVEELSWLAETAADRSRIVEIGCWKGRSTKALATATPGRVYAVDHWLGSESERAGPHKEAIEAGADSMFDQFCRNLVHEIAAGKVVPIRQDSELVAKTLGATIRPDFAFIDGSHVYADVRRDIERWHAVCAPGAILSGHDFDRPEVASAVRDALGIDFIPGPGSIWWTELPS